MVNQQLKIHANGLAWCLTQCNKLAWRGMTIPSYIIPTSNKVRGSAQQETHLLEEQSPLKLPYSVVILDTLSEPWVRKQTPTQYKL
jgi:hypothetical protein